jgi:hypothetical protein
MRVGIIFSLLVVLTGCEAIMSGLKSACNMNTAKVWLEKVTFKASEDLNDTAPVIAHVVIVYSPDLLKDLLNCDANTYFKKAQQLKDDNGDNIEVFATDIMPGRTVDLKINPKKVTGEAALLFIRYDSKGDHRASIGKDYTITVNLGKTDFTIAQPEENKK